MPVEVPSTGAGFVDHRGESLRLGFQDLDLAIDPNLRVDQDRAPLGRILRLAEALPVALAGVLVLEELADLGEGEAGIVTEAPDEQEPLEI
jgi:hypothetical protein